jgi:probable HAF family extracellular repeat protein
MGSGSRAFFFKSDVFNAINIVSSALTSEAWGVNKSGQVVGWYQDAQGAYHGFISEGTNALTFDYPGATATAMYDINDSGDIAGDFSQGGNYQGFLYNKTKNTFTPINYPSAMETSAYGVNASDVVVGTYLDSAWVSHGFLWNNGVFSEIDYPGATNTIAVGINDSGLIAGYSDEGDGFLFDGKTYTTVDVPNGRTLLSRVKNNQNVAGCVLDSFGNYHGVIGH